LGDDGGKLSVCRILYEINPIQDNPSAKYHWRSGNEMCKNAFFSQKNAFLLKRSGKLTRQLVRERPFCLIVITNDDETHAFLNGGRTVTEKISALGLYFGETTEVVNQFLSRLLKRERSSLWVNRLFILVELSTDKK
jgi:hypothetical protein